MKRACDILNKASLFSSIGCEVFRRFGSRINIKVMWKGEVLANEGDECTGIGIVVSGQLALQKYAGSGDFATIELLQAGDMYGLEYILGSNNKYGMAIEALSGCKILTVPKDIFLSLMEEFPVLAERATEWLADKVQERNRRITVLAQRSLRQKISAYLLDLYACQQEEEAREEEEAARMAAAAGSMQIIRPGVPSARQVRRSGFRFNAVPVREELPPSVELPASKEISARLLAIPRPSFSRELVRMEEDGLITVNDRIIWLRSLEGLDKEADEEDEF
ncbi:MAG: Crp/Fnr family transcriptional regulator [Clostridiaceae bacterium]|nr:Crp/Fnr family transcriptional regulator [Clostridiaceae bacterium]